MTQKSVRATDPLKPLSGLGQSRRIMAQSRAWMACSSCISADPLPMATRSAKRTILLTGIPDAAAFERAAMRAAQVIDVLLRHSYTLHGHTVHRHDTSQRSIAAFRRNTLSLLTLLPDSEKTARRSRMSLHQWKITL